MVFMFLSWIQKSEVYPALAVWSEICWLWFYCKVSPPARVQRGWDCGVVNGQGKLEEGFPPNCSLARTFDTVCLEAGLYPLCESVDDKQPVKDALGHSRHLKKSRRYGTEIYPINCVSVPYMKTYATIESLTKPSSPFLYLKGVRTLRVWKPRFCSCPCLKFLPPLSSALIASFKLTWMGSSILLSSRSSVILYKNERFLWTCGNE